MKTTLVQDVIPSKEATELYYHLKKTIEWEEGVRSKKGFTRLAKAINPIEYPELMVTILDVMKQIPVLCNSNYVVLGVYLNYYRDGSMWTPNHSHPKQHQLVISLGATRTLTVGKKEYAMTNGSAVAFGSSIHGVPKDEHVTRGRISIAVFMIPS